MNARVWIGWAVAGLMAALMLVSAVPDVLRVPEAMTVFKHLGYPPYLLLFLGTAKMLGVAAVLAPGVRTLKEWAFAGLTFDLLGALYLASLGQRSAECVAAGRRRAGVDGGLVSGIPDTTGPVIWVDDVTPTVHDHGSPPAGCHTAGSDRAGSRSAPRRIRSRLSSQRDDEPGCIGTSPTRGTSMGRFGRRCSCRVRAPRSDRARRNTSRGDRRSSQPWAPWPRNETDLPRV